MSCTVVLERMLEKKMASTIFIIRKKISKLSFIQGLFVYEWEMGNPYTLKRCDVTAFKDRKSPIKPVKNHMMSQLSPLISHFQFPVSRSHVLKHSQIYYLDRYSLTGKWYLGMRDCLIQKLHFRQFRIINII